MASSLAELSKEYEELLTSSSASISKCHSQFHGNVFGFLETIPDTYKSLSTLPADALTSCGFPAIPSLNDDINTLSELISVQKQGINLQETTRISSQLPQLYAQASSLLSNFSTGCFELNNLTEAVDVAKSLSKSLSLGYLSHSDVKKYSSLLSQLKTEVISKSLKIVGDCIAIKDRDNLIFASNILNKLNMSSKLTGNNCHNSK
ncbi:hypothetical protein GEMRC1_001523 [Eukaryota sp. GEM-RC1]